MATKPKLPARNTVNAKSKAALNDPNFDKALMLKNYENLLGNSVASANANVVPQDNRQPMYFAAMEAELQKQFMDQNPQLRPPAGKGFDPEILRRNNVEFEKYRVGLNQKYYNDVGQYIPEDQKKYSYPKFLESVVDPSKVSPEMAANLARLRSDYGKITAGPIGGTTNLGVPPVAPVVPVVPNNQVNPNLGQMYKGGRDDNKLKTSGSAQQMQDYNKMLQQGIQNNNAINQTIGTSQRLI